MFCTECGQQIADEAKFCAFCGTRRLVQAANQEKVAPPPPRPEQPATVPPPAQRAIRSTAEIMPIRPRSAEPPASPVNEGSAVDFEGLPPIEPEAPWLERESAAPPMPAMPEPPVVSRERAYRTPPPPPPPPPAQEPVSRPQAPAASGYSSVPFAAEPGAYDASERRKMSPVLIAAIIVAIIAIAGIVWMVRSTVSFGGKASTPVAITIYPTSAKIAPGKSVDFVAEVSGAPASEVTWTVEEGDSAGEVRSRGASAKGDTMSLYCTYTAPQKPGTYHLVATSTADKSKSATSEITVEGKPESKGH